MTATPATITAATPAAGYVATLAPGTQPGAVASLNRAAKLAAGHEYADGAAHPWHRQPVATLRKVRADLRAGFAPGTCNQSLAAIRGALRVAWQDGSLDHGDYSRRVDALKSVPGSPAPGRVLTVAQVRDLFAACAADANGPAGARDAALIAVLFGLGLRRGEARAILAADLDRAGGTLTVRGKAGRDRLAYTGANGADAGNRGMAKDPGRP